ncbi:MAG: type II toxin-antitoxin system RatA family toxin [Alphaproteobacteria bacterium]|nr:type II toxin-antitoxin system RatA family toxin [Alphaproteobacteria bacterium]
MTTHKERKHLSYTAEQLFDIVADVDQYPEFLPWCINSRIKKTQDNVFYADLTIGYKMIQEKYTSKVTCNRPNHIHVEYISGPMKHLSNHWKFTEEEDGTCTVDFYVEFEFKSIILQNLIGVFFTEIMQRMVGAFEKRAQALYDDNGFNQQG